MNLLDDERFNHQVEITAGVLEGESRQLLTDFFRELRVRRRADKSKNYLFEKKKV